MANAEPRGKLIQSSEVYSIAYIRGGNLIGAVKPAGSRHAAARVGLCGVARWRRRGAAHKRCGLCSPLRAS